MLSIQVDFSYTFQWIISDPVYVIHDARLFVKPNPDTKSHFVIKVSNKKFLVMEEVKIEMGKCLSFEQTGVKRCGI